MTLLDALRRLWTPRPPDARWPPALQRFVERAGGVDRAAAVDGVRFAVFDTETTGLDASRDRLLSIAGVAVARGAVLPGDSFEATVRQAHVGGASAAVVHGLVRRDLHRGVDERAAVDAFLEWSAGAVLVGHHVAFDVAIVEAALARVVPEGAAPPRLRAPALDTEHLARRLEGAALAAPAEHGGAARDRHSLDALLARHGLDTVSRHTAAGDALATAELLQVLLARAARRGIHTLRALLRTPTR